MNTLIYTVAVGARYVDQAELLGVSLREFGRYEGDFQVFAPEFAPSPEHAGYMGRVVAGIGLTGYDRVLYLDCDMLVANPIAPLLALDGLRAFQELPLDESNWMLWLPGWAGGPALEWGWNTGTILCDGRQWEKVCRLWLGEILLLKAWTARCWDQNAFNSLIMKKQIAVQPLPREWIYFSHWDDKLWTKDTMLLHFNAGGDGDRRVNTMRSAYQALRDRA